LQHKSYITSINGGSLKHLHLTATEKDLIEFLILDARLNRKPETGISKEYNFL